MFNRQVWNLVLVLGLALAWPCLRTVEAGSSVDVAEVGALLVYSSVQATDAASGVDETETFLTITNAKGDATTIHVSFINGDRTSDKYCYECDFDVPLSGFDTETLVFSPDGPGTDINNEDIAYATGSNQNGTFGSRSCSWNEGMVIAWPERSAGDPDGDNRLFGDEVVVNYTRGYAYSLPAHSVQTDGGDSDRREFAFGSDYTALPRIVASNFLAPAVDEMPGAELVLFTLDFARQHPPETDCSLIGYDANENTFSNSIVFGCWDRVGLCDVDPEFCHPNLGLDAGGAAHTHGWFSLSCEVDHDRDDATSSFRDGNVHGAIVQRATTGTILRKNAVGAPALANASAWARLLFQSISQGDDGALTLESQSLDPLGEDDVCPDDPDKTEPGACGCGTPDTDTDGDNVPDCNDTCPGDPNKTEPGVCGCGTPDADTDGDNVPDCNDNCPSDPNKTEPGVCGCGTPDTDTDGDNVPDCNDNCPSDPNKTEPGVCGCGTPDTDTDGDNVPDCNDNCPSDPNKTEPGVCGCGTPDTDTDGDNVPDCDDNCPGDPNKTAPGVCGCGTPDTDADGDNVPDCNDNCPSDPNKTEPGVCGCGTPDTDADGDNVPDCNDNCPSDPNKTEPGVCGCGTPDTDADGDNVPDCNDNCPSDPNKTEPGVCGCGTPDTDGDGDSVPDCNDPCPADPTDVCAQSAASLCNTGQNTQIDPANIDVSLDFQVTGTTMTLTATNSGSSIWDVMNLYFNSSAGVGLQLVSVTRAATAACPACGWSLDAVKAADGFGTFDFELAAMTAANEIEPGESVTFLFNITSGGPVAASDFTTETSSGVGQYPDTVVAGKFKRTSGAGSSNFCATAPPP